VGEGVGGGVGGKGGPLNALVDEGVVGKKRRDEEKKKTFQGETMIRIRESSGA